MSEAGVFVRTPAFVEKARSLVADGLSYAEVARRLQTSAPTVRKALEAPARDLRTSGLTSLQGRLIRQYFAQGWSEKRIAAAVRIGRVKARRVLDRLRREQGDAAGAAHREGGDNSLAHATALPPRMTVKLSDRAVRMRESFKARGMSHEMATREALRVCAASNASGGVLGGACVAGGGGVVGGASFHAQSMEEAPR